MKNIDNYLTERFKINSKNIYKDNLSQKEKDKIIDTLCPYFQAGGSYQGKEYETRLEIVDKFFNKSIYDFINKYDIWEDFAEYMDIHNGADLENYIKMNNDELYNEIKDFVL